MLLRKFIFLFISLILLQCRESADTGKNAGNPEENTGINVYYNYLKEYKNKDIPKDKKSDIDRSRKIAEAELISIFQKSEKYGSKEIYLDNTSYDKISYIINEDDKLKKKFGKYIRE